MPRPSCHPPTEPTARGEGNRLDALARLASAGFCRYTCMRGTRHYFEHVDGYCTLAYPTYGAVVDAALALAKRKSVWV